MPIAVARTPEELTPFYGGVLVPTMGALHAGHEVMIARAVELGAKLNPPRPAIVSLFVNPAQFNEQSDFTSYPREFDHDLSLCARLGARCLFAPEVETVYPPNEKNDPPALPEVATHPCLEDAYRPGHFAGVCGVCKRLFELARPSRAIFGEKDWQQLAVVRAMVEMLGMDLEIVAHSTVREPDGLAMSSRNQLLTPNHRRRAVALSRALVEAGRHDDPDEAETAGRRVLLASRIRCEYFVVRDAATLGAPEQGKPSRVLMAARVGEPRLIDNAPWPGFTID